jgi:anaerobic ribonucleoside-triphosphate reductase activating protein
MRVALSRAHFPVTTLGPGRRLGIWFQGCSIRCPHCISADTWGPGRGVTTVQAVLAAVEPWLAEAEGVTVSGGEPFDQPDALRSLLLGVRARSSVDILVYSGHPIESLAPHLVAMAGLIDALITDPYDVAAPQTKVLRGSDNQRLHRLTPLGEKRFAVFERAALPEDWALDVTIDDDGAVWMTGIPRRNDLRRLQAALAAAGHTVITSQAAATHRTHVSSPSTAPQSP